MACATVVGRQPDERIARRGEGGQDGPRAPKNVAQAVKRAQRGDRQALAFLYACYADDIYGYVRSIVHDHHEAEDVTQQVFAKLIGVIGSYKEREVPFFAWILRVARNAAIDHIRKRRLVPVEEVRLPPRSRIWTFTPPVPPLMAVPATAVVGWALKASWAGAPTAMLKEPEVAPVRPVREAASV